MNMGAMVHNSTLLIFLISASLLSTSFAGREWKYVDRHAWEVTAKKEDMSKKTLHHGERTDVHERLLRVNTKDYGRYDSAPTLVKPPFKLIPN